MAERRSTSSAYPPRQHISLRYSNPDVFSDEHEVDLQGSIDGHQARLLDRDESHDVASHTKVAETPRRSFSFQQTLEAPLGTLRHSGGFQRSDGQSSISSRLNGRSSSRSSQPARSMTSMSDISNSPSTAQRSSRTISTFGFPRSQSPYQGATGPSHPYGMYPQDIGLTRTPSTATTSTVRRPERSYSGPSGPTQPYGMYSQNTVPEDDLDTVAGLAPPIVAGFPGRGQDYQRRLGPDGEDVDDLIGPDGYTEQLPAYSRYANAVPPKYSSGIGSMRRSVPEPQIPLEDSQETLHIPQIRDQAGLVNPFNDSSTRLDSTSDFAEHAVPPKDEGGNFKERIKAKSRTKVCCGLLPWWLLGVIIFVIFLAVLLGGVIGGVVAHDRGEEKGRKEAIQNITAVTAAPVATVTAYAPDAIPLSSTPSGLPPLATGSFSVVLDGPSTTSNSCLTNSVQSSAWDCATGANLKIDITMTDSNVPVLSLSYPTLPGAKIRYGAQPPALNGPVTLSLNTDSDTPNKGPAYSFCHSYNKTVIVRQEDLPGGSQASKRSFMRRWLSDDDGLKDPASLFERDSSQFPYSQYAKAGEQPWYCFWNDTSLEGFVFVTQNAENNTGESRPYPSVAVTSAATPSAPYQGRAKRQAPTNLSAYPKIIKIEERRSVHNAIRPYCQQMQILYNQQLGFTVPGSDSPLTIQLDETEAPFQQKMWQGGGAGGPGGPGPAAMSAALTSLPWKRKSYDKRASNGEAPSCHCQWMSGA